MLLYTAPYLPGPKQQIQMMGWQVVILLLLSLLTLTCSVFLRLSCSFYLCLRLSYSFYICRYLQLTSASGGNVQRPPGIKGAGPGGEGEES